MIPSRDQRFSHALLGTAGVLLLTAVAFISGCSSSSSSSSQVVVSTTVATQQGVVSGIDENGAYAFKGIPYAAPPLGTLRWKSPQPVAPWQGTLPTTAFKPPCVQPEKSTSSSASFPSTTAIGSEDCLYLNVWTPSTATSASALPVMVFSHGGADLFGSSSESISFILNNNSSAAWYGGSRISARGNVIVVTLNYRLGALGFLAHSGMAADSDTGGSVGNYGLMDHIAALRWVQDNIAAFGGDPNRVMIFGQSAGGYNVCALIASPLASGLFSRALMESGSCALHSAAEAQVDSQAVIDDVGCGNAPDLMACLRNVSGVTFALAPSAQPNAIGSFSMFPSIDGYVVDDDPINVIMSSNHNPVPFIIGSNSEEYYPRINNITDLDYPGMVEALVGAANLVQALTLYPLSNYTSADDALADVYADKNIVCPAGWYAGLMSMNQTAPVYRYYFTRTLSTSERLADGAYHSSELLYVFQHMDGVEFDANDDDRAVEATVLDYWTRFAANGDPNGSPEPFWSPVSFTNDSYQKIDVTTVSGTDLKTDKCNFWSSL